MSNHSHAHRDNDNVCDDSHHKPNKETLAAHKEALEGKGTVCETMEDFWNKMEIPNFKKKEP